MNQIIQFLFDFYLILGAIRLDEEVLWVSIWGQFVL